jgi:hypothetical protein
MEKFSMFELILTILGLCIFEIITSVDNAVINAHVLKTMSVKYRKIFLFWGIIIAVFVVRGVLPFLIVWLANPALSFTEVFTFALSNNPDLLVYVERSKPLLLISGGLYLILLFLSWLFLEDKNWAFYMEEMIQRQSVWFYAFASIVVTLTIYLSIKVNPMMALAASLGATAFFITDGFKKNAEEKEKQLLESNLGAWSKILYLEVLDATFSIDGVIGAFAFTISVPLILIGNGIGAFVVRELTIKGIDKISQYMYLKNGAMYSIGVLGAIMSFESFGVHIPYWIAPVSTFILLGIFLGLSLKSKGHDE